MCGRFALKAPKNELMIQFDLFECPELAPRYNLAPMQLLPVIRQRPNGERVVHLLQWGLIPSWSKDDSIAAKLINARAETVAEKPSFRAAFKSRRCIIPASGYYEWQQTPRGKQPHYIYPADGHLFAFAGIWERWTRPVTKTHSAAQEAGAGVGAGVGAGAEAGTGAKPETDAAGKSKAADQTRSADSEPDQDIEIIDSFAVITTTANDSLQAIHERMPVMLAPEDYGVWLSRDTDPARLKELLKPCNPALTRMHRVSKQVGNARFDEAGLIVAV